MTTKYCSPAKVDNIKKFKSCFDKPALIRLINAFNDRFPDKAIKVQSLEKKSFKVLHRELSKRFEHICGSDEACWVSNISVGNPNIIDENEYFRPKTPITWRVNPREWLDENNITAVLRQYEKAYAPYYKFLGTHPSNFLRKDPFDNSSCYNKHICSIDIKELYKSGVRCIGMVVNLDPHYMGGSHWTSLFACICPLKPCFGVYYYDSCPKGNLPSDVIKFMDIIEEQCKLVEVTGRRKVFKKKISNIKHQYGNTECGVFSIYNQIKWLECFSKMDGRSVFKEVFNSNITDELMIELRKVLFRPI